MTPQERSNLRELRKLANASNATVTIDRDFATVDCRVTARDGYWFEVEGLHEFVDCSYTGWEPDYADLTERLRLSPAVPHDDPECAWCHEDSDA